MPTLGSQKKSDTVTCRPAWARRTWFRIQRGYGVSAWDSESAQVIAPLHADILLLCVFCLCAASMQGGIGIVLQPNNVGEMVIRHLVPSGPAEHSAKVLRQWPVRGLRVSCTLSSGLLDGSST